MQLPKLLTFSHQLPYMPVATSALLFPTSIVTQVMVETGVHMATSTHATQVQISFFLLHPHITTIDHHQDHILVIAKSVAFRVIQQKGALPSELFLSPIPIQPPLCGHHKPTWQPAPLQFLPRGCWTVWHPTTLHLIFKTLLTIYHIRALMMF